MSYTARQPPCWLPRLQHNRNRKWSSANWALYSSSVVLKYFKREMLGSNWLKEISIFHYNSYYEYISQIQWLWNLWTKNQTSSLWQFQSVHGLCLATYIQVADPWTLLYQQWGCWCHKQDIASLQYKICHWFVAIVWIHLHLIYFIISMVVKSFIIISFTGG